MAFIPPPQVAVSKMTLWEPSLGFLELGDRPFIVEGFQIGSPDIRENTKNRSLMDGVFDDTLFHGASAITVTTRLSSHLRCSAAEARYMTQDLRNKLVSYCSPRLRPRLYWCYPGDTVGQWATVRGASWPFAITTAKYPTLVVQFKNPSGIALLGDLEDEPNTVVAFPGEEAGGRTYDLVHDRDYPNVDVPLGTRSVVNEGNAPAGWTMTVLGPFDAGAVVRLGDVSIQFNDELVINESVTLKTLNKTILRENGTSYYPFTNFGDWAWDDVLLQPGSTELSMDAVLDGAPSGSATMEWYSTVL